MPITAHIMNTRFTKQNNYIATQSARQKSSAALTCIMIISFIIGQASQAWAPYRHAIDDPLNEQKSIVYEVYGQYAIRGMKLHHASIKQMFNTGIRKLAETKDIKEAWRHFISDDDRVAIVFTQFGGPEIGVNTEVASDLLKCLYDAGFKAENFMLVGLESLPPEADGTIPCQYGWQKETVDFHLDQGHLVGWLEQVTAIINVPSILDDNIVGLRCSLHNLSLPLLKSPAKLYRNGSDPFIPAVYQLPQIRDKVRLHIANSLRLLYYGGPTVNQTYVAQRNSFLFSTDPVALDTVAMYIVRHARETMLMPAQVKEKLTAPYLDTSAYMGLGYTNLNFIDYRRVRHDKW